LPVITSIGCNQRCNFCDQYGNQVLFYSSDEIIDQINTIKSIYGIYHFLFINQYLNISYNKTEELCKKIVKNNLGIKWMSYPMPDNLDEDLIRLMAESGCIELVFGLESASKHVLELMNKSYDLERFKEVLKLCQKYGISVKIFLITGYPGETREDFRETLNFIKRYGRFINSVGVCPIVAAGKSKVLKDTKRKYPYLKPEALYQLLGGMIPMKSDISKKESDYRFRETSKYAYKYVHRREYPFLRFIPFFLFHDFYDHKKAFRNPFLYRAFQIICRFIPLHEYMFSNFIPAHKKGELIRKL